MDSHPHYAGCLGNSSFACFTSILISQNIWKIFKFIGIKICESIKKNQTLFLKNKNKFFFLNASFFYKDFFNWPLLCTRSCWFPSMNEIWLASQLFTCSFNFVKKIVFLTTCIFFWKFVTMCSIAPYIHVNSTNKLKTSIYNTNSLLQLLFC